MDPILEIEAFNRYREIIRDAETYRTSMPSSRGGLSVRILAMISRMVHKLSDRIDLALAESQSNTSTVSDPTCC